MTIHSCSNILYDTTQCSVLTLLIISHTQVTLFSQSRTQLWVSHMHGALFTYTHTSLTYLYVHHFLVQYFSTFSQSFVSLFITLTTAKWVTNITENWQVWPVLMIFLSQQSRRDDGLLFGVFSHAPFLCRLHHRHTLLRFQRCKYGSVTYQSMVLLVCVFLVM